MSVPPQTLKAYEKTRVDVAIERFAMLENPTLSDINAVRVQASIEDDLAFYRMSSVSMEVDQLQYEDHSSKRLAEFMEFSEDPRPSDSCDAHAMISGRHRGSAPMRAIMAWCLVRVDDPRNGCWLPRHYDVIHKMPKWLSGAVPHQGLHNNKYYIWLQKFINVDSIESRDDLISALKKVREFLQSGALPPEAWPKRGKPL